MTTSERQVWSIADDCKPKIREIQCRFLKATCQYGQNTGKMGDMHEKESVFVHSSNKSGIVHSCIRSGRKRNEKEMKRNRRYQIWMKMGSRSCQNWTQSVRCQLWTNMRSMEFPMDKSGQESEVILFILNPEAGREPVLGAESGQRPGEKLCHEQRKRANSVMS